MRKELNTNRDQIYLMPPSISEWLPDKHLARFVVEILEQIDLSCITRKYRDVGGKYFNPKILLGLIIYGYSTGVFSSRKIEIATYESVAFRFISGDLHPDHDTIASFRKNYLPEIKVIFKQIVIISKELGFTKFGNLSIDGTKEKANASKHKAMSYKRAKELEEQFSKEIEELLKIAEDADNKAEDIGIDIPEEIKIRENRLLKIREAIQKIKERAEERYKEEKKEYDEKMRKRQEKNGRKGKAPKEPKNEPEGKDQYNFTDPESRIMKSGSGTHFEQCYNGQLAVDQESMLIAETHLSNHPNDKQVLDFMVDNFI
jgi:transposase